MIIKLLDKDRQKSLKPLNFKTDLNVTAARHFSGGPGGGGGGGGSNTSFGSIIICFIPACLSARSVSFEEEKRVPPSPTQRFFQGWRGITACIQLQNMHLPIPWKNSALTNDATFWHLFDCFSLSFYDAGRSTRRRGICGGRGYRRVSEVASGCWPSRTSSTLLMVSTWRI